MTLTLNLVDEYKWVCMYWSDQSLNMIPILFSAAAGTGASRRARRGASGAPGLHKEDNNPRHFNAPFPKGFVSQEVSNKWTSFLQESTSMTKDCLIDKRSEDAKMRNLSKLREPKYTNSNTL
jgi:hypothetical protein